MTSHIDLTTMSIDSEQSANTFSANEIVKHFIMNRSPGFAKLDELRILVES
jgi:hypothetical protein